VGTDGTDVVKNVETFGFADGPKTWGEVVLGAGDGIAVLGTAGGDTLQGGTGYDVIYGYAGADDLRGNGGGDLIRGYAGNDTLDGGLGNDTLTGGLDADSFVFSTALGGTNIDSITDFAAATDSIRLEDLVFDVLPNGVLDLDAFQSDASASALTPEVRIVHDTSNNALYYDQDGSGAAVAVQFAMLSGLTGSLTENNFVVY
jgi:Ca2+-binding RTX toxin-like protein